MEDLDLEKVSEFFRTHTYCGAKTRAGTPCKRKDIYYPSGRCRLNAGLSTGPKIEPGNSKLWGLYLKEEPKVAGVMINSGS